jgi:membrane protease YdiL (CAAX protease family)
MNKPLIFAELGAIYFLVPFAVWRQWLPVPLIVIPLYILAAYGVWWLVRRGGFGVKQFWAGENIAAEKVLLKTIALRFVAVMATVWLVVYVVYPEKMLALPDAHPVIWLLFLVLYPPLSVVPQELLYRAFFFARYKAIFPNKNMMIAASALCFMFMHIVFGNGIALLSTFIGGVLFAMTYSRSRSLRLVCLEHTLYGYVIFTFGLGEFLVFGAMKTFLT